MTAVNTDGAPASRLTVDVQDSINNHDMVQGLSAVVLGGDPNTLYMCRSLLAEAIGNPLLIAALCKLGANPNRYEHHGGTLPLILAVEDFDMASVRALISSGCDVNARDSLGQTALHKLVWPEHARSGLTNERRREVLECLIGNGADPDARDKHQLSPLQEARRLKDSIALSAFANRTLSCGLR